MPVVAGFLLAAHRLRHLRASPTLGTARFVGLGNYAALLHDPVFWKALAQHLLLRARRRAADGRGVARRGAAPAIAAWRALQAVSSAPSSSRPVVTTLVAVAVVWRYLYHPRFGLLEPAPRACSALPDVDWLGDPRWAMPAIILLAVWKNFGYDMIIFVAGLQSIPDHALRGRPASTAPAPWQQFRHITLPLLAPDVDLRRRHHHDRLLPDLRRALRHDGGRAARSTPRCPWCCYMYKQGFRWWSMGFAAAVAFVLFLLILRGHAGAVAAAAGAASDEALVPAVALHLMLAIGARRDAAAARLDGLRVADAHGRGEPVASAAPARAGRRSRTTESFSNGSTSAAASSTARSSPSFRPRSPLLIISLAGYAFAKLRFPGR